MIRGQTWQLEKILIEGLSNQYVGKLHAFLPFLWY
jgi:hypothetical protein